MKNYDTYEDMIPVYLSGKLDKSEQADLESKLAESPELRAALLEFRQISLGLKAMEAISGGHIDSELLVAYSDNLDSLEPRARQEIERHLADCGDCREELTLCVLVPETDAAESGTFATFLKWLMTPKMALKPLHVAVVVCLLALPQLYMLSDREMGQVSMTELHLESVTRDIETTNTLKISPDHTVVNLTFTIPSIDNRRYNLELYDSANQLVFTKPNHPPENILDVEIPTTYFHEGLYQLRIIEIDANQNATETFEYQFKVVFTTQ